MVKNLKKTNSGKAQESTEYVFHTGQEIDILEQSACDGKSSTNWRNVQRYGNGHRFALSMKCRVLHTSSKFAPMEGEIVKIDALERLTMAQDADFAFAMLYVASLVAPPSPLEANLAAIGWIDLDDVMEKIGWYPQKRTAIERKALRLRIWNYILYGNRARVTGQRTTTYKDPYSKEIIPTVIASSIWRIMKVERDQTTEEVTNGQMIIPGLGELTEAPRRVQIVIDKEWEPLLTAPRLAQYLPLAELAGEISPKKVSGDWARCISLALARFWRSYPREAISGSLLPRRVDLLTHYRPKTRTVEELLNSTNPRRAVEYWCDAIAELAQKNIVAGGEVTRTFDNQFDDLTDYKWQDQWLEERVNLMPGKTMRPHVEERANALPILKTVHKRGRPKK